MRDDDITLIAIQIRIPANLHAVIKKMAKDGQMTLGYLVLEALKEKVRATRAAQKATREEAKAAKAAGK